MLKLSEFRHNHHHSEVSMLEKVIRGGVSVLDHFLLKTSASRMYIPPVGKRSGKPLHNRFPQPVRLSVN